MSNPQANNSNAFRDLRFDQLQRYAKRWVKKFSQVPIQKVLLYHASNDYFRDTPLKYVVIFEVSGDPHSELKSIGREFTKYICKHNLASGAFDPTEHVERIEKNQTPFDDLLTAVNHDKRAFIDAGFDVVYNSKPDTMENCLAEWAFKIKTSGTWVGKNIKTDEPFWLLYTVKQDTALTLQETYPEESKDSISTACTGKKGENYFILKGDYWEVGFAGEASTLKDSKGLRTIVALLKNPNHKFSPTELSQIVESGSQQSLYDEETTQQYTRMSRTYTQDGDSMLEEENLTTNVEAIEKLTKKEKADLKENIKEAYDRFKAGEITEEKWDLVVEYAQQDKGLMVKIGPKGLNLSFQSRLVADNEKARKRIYKNIKKFKESIKKDLPKLKQHLDQNITPGAFMPTYAGDNESPVSWNIKD